MIQILHNIFIIVHLLQFGSTLKSFQQEITGILDDIQTDSKAGKHQTPYGGVPRGRTYVSGWTPRMERSDVDRQSTIRDTGVGLARSVSYTGGSDSSSYTAVKARCLQSRSLWEDPDFPPVARSLYYKRAPSAWPDIQWKRPHVGIFSLQ